MPRDRVSQPRLLEDGGAGTPGCVRVQEAVDRTEPVGIEQKTGLCRVGGHAPSDSPNSTDRDSWGPLYVIWMLRGIW